MGGVVDSVGSALGFGGKSSVKQAGGEQLAATREQIDYLKGAEERARGDLSPFRQLGIDAIPQLQSLLSTDGQSDYLASNPMFQAAIDQSGEQIKSLSAATGKYGSGGTVGQLFQNYLAQGNDFVNSQYNRLLQPLSLGQSAAAGTAANTLSSGSQIGGALSNAGDVRAASILGQQNAQAQLGGNLLQLGSMAFGFSDERLKTDIEHVGVDGEGNNVYEYSYKSPDRYRGYMAQELAEKNPYNVLLDPSGYLKVTQPEHQPRRIS